jgi:hypothetical protein
MESLVAQCSHEPTSSSSRPFTSAVAPISEPKRGKVTTLGEEEEEEAAGGSDEEGKRDPVGELSKPPPTPPPSSRPLRKTGFDIALKSKTSPETKIGQGMQSSTVTELHSKQERLVNPAYT